MAPGLLLIGLFLLVPVLQGIRLSMFRFDGVRTGEFLGLGNYAALLRDPVFATAVGHTLVFAVITVVGKNVVGLALAVLANSRLRGARQAQLLLFLPVTLNIVVVGAFWTNFLASAQYGGLVNAGLGAVGLGGLARSWLSEPGVALVVVALVETWRWAGLHMLLFLAALQAIEPSLYDAARLDGATPWDRFRHVTLPALGPIIAASSMLALIGSFVRSFDIVWVLTRAGYGTDVLATYIYREAFTFGRFDRATAAGLMLAFVATLIFAVGQLIARRRAAP
jgi:ABC-type sugar transport system permease subunit